MALLRHAEFVCLFLRLCLDLRLDHGVPFGDGIADGRDADIGAVEADIGVALDDGAVALARHGAGHRGIAGGGGAGGGGTAALRAVAVPAAVDST